MKKKVLFIQLKGNSFGGVWQVIHTISNKLVETNYDVTIVSLRENKGIYNIEHNPKIKLHTINKIDNWEESYSGSEILKDIKKVHIKDALKKINIRLKHEKSVKKDKKELQKYIYKYNPDYIIVSHYEFLDMIPKEYLSRTINHHHIDFASVKNHRATSNTYKKYNRKITYLWLTSNTKEEADKYGLKNNIFIYNPNRLKCDEIADIENNKKLITIARLSKQKRIDIMIDIVKEVFKDKKYKDWSLEIYGLGTLEEELRKQINNHKQIKLMGLTSDHKKEYLKSTINLCTSDYEGFCLSIIEANECGVPTITTNYGEPTEEVVINEKTGIIAENKEDYIKKLKEMMDNVEKRKEFAKNGKMFVQKFQIDNIIKEWMKLFEKIDQNKGEYYEKEKSNVYFFDRWPS